MPRCERLNDGRIIITDKDTGKEIIKEEDFWFAWYVFHPETELYENRLHISCRIYD